MKYIVVCNTGSDSLSKINLDFTKSEEFKINFNGEKLGPSGMCMDSSNIYTANIYNNTVSIINRENFKEENRIYVGAYPNDLICYHNYLYISSSEANLISVYNKKEKRLEFDIPTNGWPYSMAVDEEKKILLASNFQSHNISVIDTNKNKVIKEVNTLKYPTKIKLSKDKKKIYVCESYMGEDIGGYIEAFDSSTFVSEGKIKVGKSPMDIEEDKENLYVINFEEGTLSVISKRLKKEVGKIFIGGMPKSIKIDGSYFIISDYFNSKILIINSIDSKKRTIAVGKEPSAMIIY